MRRPWYHIYFERSPDPQFDRQVMLAALGAVAGILVGLLGAARFFNWLFWSACVVFALCLVFSRNRPAVLGLTFIVAAIRLSWGFAVYGEASLLIASIPCWILGTAFGRMSKRKEESLSAAQKRTIEP